jgi:hypothetical protein
MYHTETKARIIIFFNNRINQNLNFLYFRKTNCRFNLKFQIFKINHDKTHGNSKLITDSVPCFNLLS